ncbi:MAG: nitrate- and nitrite sensing domain-containing protein, partial [Sulfurimonas denitrificans]|nr:nitrate- and nitrite sensing domain-containing protein [Sulfurimonas denitrificans]
MNFLNIKYKLLSLSIALILLALILSFMILSQSLNEKRNYELTKRYILESSVIANVIHYMQIERGLSSGFLAKNNLDEIDTKLLLAKKDLSEAISKAKERYKTNHLSKEENLLKLLNEIELDRSNIILSTQNISHVQNYYSQKIDSLLDYVATIPTFMDDRENRNFIQALVYLSSAKESLGVIRATLNRVFIENKLSTNDYATIKGSFKNYNHNLNIFKNSVSDEFLKQFEKIFKGSCIDDTFAIIELTIADAHSENSFTTDPDYWFELSSQTINLLNKIEKNLFAHVNRAIDGELNTIFYKLALLTLFWIIGIITLISITL